jgi:hypothetical protein
VDIKIDFNALEKKLQPVIDKAGVEYFQKLADKLFTGEEKRQLVIKLVSGKVKITGPQELLNRLQKEIGKM